MAGGIGAAEARVPGRLDRARPLRHLHARWWVAPPETDHGCRLRGGARREERAANGGDDTQTRIAAAAVAAEEGAYARIAHGIAVSQWQFVIEF